MAKNKTLSAFCVAFLLLVFLPLNTKTAGDDTQAGQQADKAADAGIKSSANIFVETLEAFIKEVDSTHPFFDLKGIRQDWEICKKQLIQKVGRCTTNDDFYILLDEARRCLRDSHMGFSNLKGDYPRREVRYYPGVSFLPAVEHQVVIMSCAAEYVDKLPAGSIVTEIDGQNARELLKQQAKKSWKAGGYFSSPQRARLYIYRIPLQGKENDAHQITVIKDGKAKSITVLNKWQATGWPHTYAMPKDLKRLGDCLYGKLPSGYGYIYLRRIRSNLVQSIDAALTSFEGIRGLIIDLRGNGGGGYGREVFARFDKKQGPSEDAPFYRGDIVVLIDGGTISAGETFARDLVYCAEAHLMGSRTAGSSSAKRSWQLPHDLGTVTFSRRSRWGFEGQPIEYNGIAPHEAVEIVPSELQNGINSGIKRAEEYLEKKWTQKSEAERKLSLIVHKKADPRASKVTFGDKGNDMSGVVLDESGNPLSQVKISNWYPHGSSPQITNTNEQDKFYFKSHRGYAVKAEKEGFAPEFCEFRKKYYRGGGRAREIKITMTLTEGCTVEGTIFSKKDNKPMRGAEVWVERWAKDVSVGLNQYIIWVSEPAKTDRQGYFRVAQVPAGTIRVRARVVGFRENISNDFKLEGKGSKVADVYLSR